MTSNLDSSMVGEEVSKVVWVTCGGRLLTCLNLLRATFSRATIGSAFTSISTGRLRDRLEVLRESNRSLFSCDCADSDVASIGLFRVLVRTTSRGVVSSRPLLFRDLKVGWASGWLELDTLLTSGAEGLGSLLLVLVNPST